MVIVMLLTIRMFNMNLFKVPQSDDIKCKTFYDKDTKIPRPKYNHTDVVVCGVVCGTS